MIRIISNESISSRDEFLAALNARSVGIDAELLSSVSRIIDDVRTRGDAALIEYAARFDGADLEASQLCVSAAVIEESARRVDAEVLTAIREAIRNVKFFHERQRERSWLLSKEHDVYVGQRITPIEKVGLYVPGGTAAYPSSVVMNVVPARVAGVPRVTVATPPNTVQQNPAVAAALLELEVDEIYAVGGAQAIAALAFGTETVPAVDKITGPGNKYVAAAKKLVFGVVGIDSIAGPTEVVVVADESAPAEFIAADLLAQAEHAVDASSILITNSRSLADQVSAELEKQVLLLPRRDIVEQSLSNFGALIVVGNIDEACELVNQIAPEHLELMTSDNDDVAAKVKHAGAIFFGPNTPEAVGDYFAGPNHVLPTGRTARFSSALGVYDFVKRTSLIRYSQEAIASTADKIEALAEAEGLGAHAQSIGRRKKEHSKDGEKAADEEMRQVLAIEVSRLRKCGYQKLLEFLNNPVCLEVSGSSGTKYQIEVEALWDDEPQYDLRVMAAIDDGSFCRALAPLSDSFIMRPDGTFVGE